MYKRLLYFTCYISAQIGYTNRYIRRITGAWYEKSGLITYGTPTRVHTIETSAQKIIHTPSVIHTPNLTTQANPTEKRATPDQITHIIRVSRYARLKNTPRYTRTTWTYECILPVEQRFREWHAEWSPRMCHWNKQQTVYLIHLIIFQSLRHVRYLQRPICRCPGGSLMTPAALSPSLADNFREEDTCSEKNAKESCP